MTVKSQTHTGAHSTYESVLQSEERGIRNTEKKVEKVDKKKKRTQMSLFAEVCKLLNALSVIFNTTKKLSKKTHTDDR